MEASIINSDIYKLFVFCTTSMFLIFLVRALFYYKLSQGQHPDSQKCKKYSAKVGDSILFLQVDGFVMLILFIMYLFK